ncbi:MAG: PTS glucose transporter subunit IIA [Oenococcus sp.]|uniref:PTS sugar transporter subunit IIA n=1 Tax=Oenococcus sp. TaxID=1979414 RepID=UPI0039EA275F
MFGLFHKKVETESYDHHLYSPADGRLENITSASDPVFSKKLMGDGFVIFPTAGQIVSPVAGVVTMIAETKHAIGIKTNGNQDVLIHLGIDTVNLNGLPFELSIRNGDTVRGGMEIATMDLEQVRAANLSSEILVIFMKSEGEIPSAQIALKTGVYHQGDVVGRFG